MACSVTNFWQAEQSSVSQLLSLLGRTIEAISFILLLSDHRLGELISQYVLHLRMANVAYVRNSCDPEIQKLVSSLTFEDLITVDKGVTASRALVNVIINQQIGQQISVSRSCVTATSRILICAQVDTISEVLQQRCGSFCSTDDVMLYKVGACVSLLISQCTNLDHVGAGEHS